MNEQVDVGDKILVTEIRGENVNIETIVDYANDDGFIFHPSAELDDGYTKDVIGYGNNDYEYQILNSVSENQELTNSYHTVEPKFNKGDMVNYTGTKWTMLKNPCKVVSLPYYTVSRRYEVTCHNGYTWYLEKADLTLIEDTENPDFIGKIADDGKEYFLFHAPKDDDDEINPNHYKKYELETIDTIEGSSTPEEFKGYLKGNIFKYVSRYEDKDGLQDIEKAEWYLNRLKETVEKESE